MPAGRGVPSRGAAWAYFENTPRLYFLGIFQNFPLLRRSAIRYCDAMPCSLRTSIPALMLLLKAPRKQDRDGLHFYTEYDTVFPCTPQR